MQRYMGLDIGTKTIGVSLSDPMLMIANGLVTIKRTNINEDIEKLRKLIVDNQVIKLIVGMPYNMNKTIGPSGQRVMSFIDNFKKQVDIDIDYIDERLTTVSAERVLIENKVRREKRKEHVDKIAATFILQTYLDRK